MSGEATYQTITLPDGRALGFAEYGEGQKTVLYFNGSGGSRLEHPADLGIRLVATDRPGHGLSSPQEGRKLLD